MSREEQERRLREVLAIAIGQASMCWQYPERAGNFQVDAAGFLVDETFRDVMAVLAPPSSTRPHG